MKFGEKYELLESITTGGVETFVANDKVRGERVLVHILDCEAQKPNQPTAHWVLEAFRRVAPEPVALLLETGRYSGTLYGYLVTKMPGEAALTQWVQLYRAQARETREIPGPLAKPNAEPESPTADLSAKARPQVLGAVSPPPFRDFSATPKPDRPSDPTKEAEHLGRAQSNTQPAGDRSEIGPAPDWNAVASGISAQGKPGPNRSSPVSFSSAFAPRNFPSEPNPPAIKDAPIAGVQQPTAPNSPPPDVPSPSIQSLPAIAPTPMPAARAMPKMAVPPAPTPAKVAITEPSVSSWPLISTLIVLFLIAGLLVLYFALKH